MGNSLLVVISLVAFFSVSLTALASLRLYHYISAYRFERSQYRPLFGFLHLRIVLAAYCIGSALFAAVSVVLFLNL